MLGKYRAINVIPYLNIVSVVSIVKIVFLPRSKDGHVISIILDFLKIALNVDEFPLYFFISFNLHISNNTSNMLEARSERFDNFGEIFAVSKTETRLSNLKANEVFLCSKHIWKFH